MERKVALVTGCSSGFGLLAAVTLARRGFAVAASMRSPSKRARLDEALCKAGVTATVIPLDVASEASIGEALARTAAELGPVEVLVNNAGFGIGGFVYDLSMAELREQMETNFFGAVALSKAVLPGMIARRSGRIINVSSIGGRVALPVMAAYSASKFALEGFSESLRTEVAPFHIRVTLIEPGTFRTDIFEANRRVAAAGRDPASPFVKMSEAMEKLVDGMVAKSTQDPQWVADAIADAATVARPKLRYLVGKDAWAQALVKGLLPWSVLEWAILRQSRLRDHVMRPPSQPEGGTAP